MSNSLIGGYNSNHIFYMIHLRKGPGIFASELSKSPSTQRQQITCQWHFKNPNKHRQVKTQKLLKENFWICVSPLISLFAGCLCTSQWILFLNFSTALLRHNLQTMSFILWFFFISFEYLWWSFCVYGTKFIHTSSWMHPKYVCGCICLCLCVPILKSVWTCVCGFLSYGILVPVYAWTYISMSLFVRF